MRYVVEPKEHGFTVVDSQLNRPVTMPAQLETVTPNREDAERYAARLNELLADVR